MHFIDWAISLGPLLDFNYIGADTVFVRLLRLFLLSLPNFQDTLHPAWCILSEISVLRRLREKDCLLQVQGEAGIRSVTLYQLRPHPPPPSKKAKPKDKVPYPGFRISLVKHVNVCECFFRFYRDI